ncbi:MAG: FAD-dependent oxidoreductase, partial [Clostridia bacterium]
MKKPVLVLGGGIAGIQAALDLAEMEVPVFIVENSPSIGGRMAQLDKTFPTNDCSACILAPKVTSCFNHPLIKTFTWSDLVEIKGEAPDFTVIINKKARFIDEDVCVGCNACTLKCPIDIKSEFDMEIGVRHAVYKPYAQAVPNKVVIDKKGTSPCTFNCPAHINAHGIASLVRKGRFEEALKLARKVTPFVGILGRTCSGDCESHCYKKHVDSPVAIHSLERFIADYEIDQGRTPKMAVPSVIKQNKIAVIGAGPAGLNCAYQLALKGYPVTVFEQMEQPGGTLRTRVSENLSDAAVLDREIQLITDIGVQIECNVEVGKDLTIDGLREQGYEAFFVAVGNQSKKNVAGIMESLTTDENGNIVCDEADIFIGGDIISGAITAVEAIAAGNRAAISISNYLEGTDIPQTPFLLPQTPIGAVDFKRGAALVSSNTSLTAEKQLEFIAEAAKKEASRCMDCSICSECKACEQICPPKAIRHEQRDEMIEIPVSAVVLASGYDTSKNIPDIFGYKKYPNVVTSLEYERILSASGPYQGHVQRPSDKKAPSRIAFIQCVGSRDYKCDTDYCSAVCCMYAVKEAIITKEHLHTVRDIDIFYMDMRAYGKDFDKYIDSAKNKHGISFIRSRVADITEDKETENLIIRYCDSDGNMISAEYDMVVLSVGLCSKPEIQPLMG